jgi:branched-chain amino acid transport system substrate-binding protein
MRTGRCCGASPGASATFLTKVKALKPDVLLVSGHEKGAATAARQMGEHKIN